MTVELLLCLLLVMLSHFCQVDLVKQKISIPGELTYEQIRERNIQERLRLFNELNISQSKSSLVSSLGIGQVKPFDLFLRIMD